MSDPTQGFSLDRTGRLPRPDATPTSSTPEPVDPVEPTPLEPPDPTPQQVVNPFAPPDPTPQQVVNPFAPPTAAPPPVGSPYPSPAPAAGGTAYPSAAGTSSLQPAADLGDPWAAPPSPSADRRKRSRPARRSSVPIVLAALVAGVIGGLGGGVLAQTLDGSGPDTVQSQPDGRLPDPVPVSVAPDGSIAGLSRSALPSVALISVGPGGRDGQGSGFVIREDGYLLTNHHVIAAAEAGGGITVSLPGQEPFEAEVVGSDSVYDIAVLKVDQSGLSALPFADSDAVEVGQTVVAVGAPLGLDSTVTSGIVSALNRPVTAGDAGDVSFINAIQTDAAINPGNSGGPLLDLAGNVVGVNSAIAQTPTTTRAAAGSIGLGFAIPAEQAERTAAQLIETGSSQHPVMGVHIDLAYTGDGARVLAEGSDDAPAVIPGGPAEAAGVRPGDVIVSVDGTRITDSSHLLVLLRSYAIGETVEMVLRGAGGDERTVSITLEGSGE